MVELIKNGFKYERKENGTLYCGSLDQSDKVGGTGEAIRNSIHNPTRLQRINNLCHGGNVLDFGCGNGLFVSFLKKNNVAVDGYDKFSGDFNALPEKNKYDVVTAIEVFEHLAEPYSEIDEIFSFLKEGGILMVETSFTDWMSDDNVYINPLIGHSTIFSHAGLDELMSEKGFNIGNHINRNVRLYVKPKKFMPSTKGITLILPSQGNPIALKRTLDSYKSICNEVIFGDVLIFDRDRDKIRAMQKEYNMPIAEMPFNYIFENGFASVLNLLASYATNDWVLYANVGEMIDEGEDILEKINSDHNLYLLNHRTEKHLWGRLYNRKEVQWSGMIHEEIVGHRRICDEPLFMFKDSDKDVENSFYSAVMNDVKELCYFNQYIKLVEQPELIGVTNRGWVQYSIDSYDSLKERMIKKGKRYEAFVDGNLGKYIEDIFTNPEFEKQRLESSTLVNLQGARKDIL